MHAILGLDIGGTKTALVIGTTEGAIIAREQFPSETARGFAPLFADITAAGARLLTAHPGVSVISVSIGGPLDIEKGIILSPPHLPGWDAIPLRQMLMDHFHLPVWVEHDGNAGALAEWYFGAGRGCKSMIFLTMGTGLGAGLILDQRLYRGASDVAGEIGHVRIADDGPGCYGKRGSLEGYASGEGISLLAGDMYPARWASGVTPVELASAARAGDPQAREVFRTAAHFFGRGLALLVDLVNPQRIVLGGLGMRIFDQLVEPALVTLDAEALPRARGACTIVPAALGESIGDIAALTGAIYRMSQQR